MKEDKLLQNRIEEATSRIEDRISTLSGLNDLLGLIYDAVYYSEGERKLPLAWRAIPPDRSVSRFGGLP